MKHLYLATTIIACTLYSCSYLEEYPSTSLSEAVAYSNEDVLESDLRGIILSFMENSSMYLCDMQELLQAGSCLTFFPQGTVGTNNSNERWSSAYHYTQSSTTVLNTNLYTCHYQGISRCNKLIEGLKTSPVSKSYKTEVEAEARFYRAVLYFTLVRLYGDVPLITKSPSTIAETNRKRDKYTLVYKQILEDLSFAEQNMRTALRVAEVSPGESRPNKWAATSFKAAVYCQIACLMEYSSGDQFFDDSDPDRLPVFDGIADSKRAWELALEAAETVIEESGYKLSKRYSDLFTWDKSFHSDAGYDSWNNPERIFVLPQGNRAKAGQLARRTLPPYPEGTNCSQNNSNYGRHRPTRFVFQKWCQTYGGEKGASGKENENIFVSCNDPRLDASLIHTSSVNVSTGKSYNIYPHANAIKSNSRQYFLPYFKKYLDPEYNADCGNSDYYYMRLGEIYLIAAEAAASLCEDPSDAYGTKAYQYIEALHERARADKAGATQPKWEAGRFSSKEDLIAGIMWERVFELYGEGHEWFDSHRRGAKWFLDNIIRPFNISLMQDEQTKAREWYGAQTASPFSESISDVRAGLLCAFPQQEIMYNTALSNADQNDYFWK